jgi:hypothetical protein
MEFSHSLLTTASPEKIWSIWTDVKNWKNWDFGLKDAQIQGNFGKDAEGFLVPEKGPKTPFKVTNYKPNFTYTFTSKLPFAKLHVRRLMGYHNQKTIITHDIWIEGPLSAFWWQMLGRRYSKLLPRILEKVKQIAESSQ